MLKRTATEYNVYFRTFEQRKFLLPHAGIKGGGQANLINEKMARVFKLLQKCYSAIALKTHYYSDLPS